MIVNEQVTTYLHSLERDNSALLEEMRRFAKDNRVPIIRREMESFLRFLLSVQQTEKILEIGTGIGYSAVFMAENAETVREILTIENYPPRIGLAKENLERYRKKAESRAEIRMLEADAAQMVKTLEGEYDLIFLDGPKAQYLPMLPDLKRLLRSGGILLADNVLQDGELVMSRYVTQRRDRTIHERMREFVYQVTHDPELTSTVLTVGDGVTLSRKQ